MIIKRTVNGTISMEFSDDRDVRTIAAILALEANSRAQGIVDIDFNASALITEKARFEYAMFNRVNMLAKHMFELMGY